MKRPWRKVVRAEEDLQVVHQWRPGRGSSEQSVPMWRLHLSCGHRAEIGKRKHRYPPKRWKCHICQTHPAYDHFGPIEPVKAPR